MLSYSATNAMFFVLSRGYKIIDSTQGPCHCFYINHTYLEDMENHLTTISQTEVLNMAV